MDSERTESVSSGLDTGLVAALVRELAGARRNVSSYPKGHPVVVQSCERAAGMLARVCADRDEIAFGVTRDSLMIGEGSLGSLVPAANNFVRALAHHGVALIRLRKGITAAEVEEFSQILAEKRAHLAGRGGIVQVLQQAGIRHLEVDVIQYDAFRAADDRDDDSLQGVGSRSLWEAFVRRLLNNSSAAFDEGDAVAETIKPDEIADLMNSRSPESMVHVVESLEQLLSKVDALSNLSAADRESLTRIGEFIEKLKPAQRKQFFDTILQSFQARGSDSLEIMPYLPTAAALELYTRSREVEVVLPAHILSSMERLAQAARQDSELEQPVATPGQGGLEDKLSIVFREESVDEFVPAEYLETLKSLVSSPDILAPGSRELQDLTWTLENDQIESAVSSIILESLSMAGPEQLSVLMHNLQELCRYFLEVGDFTSLENTYARLVGLSCERDELVPLREAALAFYHASEFIDEILNGVEHWGKEKFDEIGRLIQEVGDPFIEPLLDRLGEESRITLRRYYLDQLLMMADQAKDAVYARLGDKRWYVVRNLVIILQHSGDQEVLTHIRKVVDFPHPKVRQRIVEAFLFFGDPEGDKLLLQDLASSNNEVRLTAIQQAGKSRNPDVVEALATVLTRKGLSPADVAEKKAAIQALAETGDSRALPVLDRVLSARHFFKASLRNMLKQEILLSLVKYRDPLATVLLQKAAKSGNRELSRLATESLVTLEKENG